MLFTHSLFSIVLVVELILVFLRVEIALDDPLQGVHPHILFVASCSKKLDGFGFVSVFNKDVEVKRPLILDFPFSGLFVVFGVWFNKLDILVPDGVNLPRKVALFGGLKRQYLLIMTHYGHLFGLLTEESLVLRLSQLSLDHVLFVVDGLGE